MLRSPLSATVALLVATLVTSGSAGAQSPRRPKLLLIGIDGIRVDILEAATTPNLDALAAAGELTLSARIRPRTVSGPGWSSMLTGVWMNKHGVENNDFSSSRYDQYPDFLTRIELLQPELSTLAVADWPPLGTTQDGGPLLSPKIDLVININGDNLEPRQMPNYVVKVKRSDEAVKVVQLTNEKKLPVVPSNSGSQSRIMPNQGGILLDLSQMKQFQAIDTRNRKVRIEPGVTWAAVSA